MLKQVFLSSHCGENRCKYFVTADLQTIADQCH